MCPIASSISLYTSAMRHFTAFMALTLVLFSLLPGCGFRLAGNGDSAHLQNVFVQAGPASHELVHFVRGSLGPVQVDVTEPDHAAIHLHILSEETSREVLSLDASGKAREYDLMLNVAFDIRHAQSSDSLSRQKIQIHRVLVFDKYDMLGSGEEEQQLLHEMRKEAAQRIVRLVRAVSPE